MTESGRGELPASPSWFRPAWLGLVILGVVLRLGRAAIPTLAWYDEAALAISVVQRGLVDLHLPLANMQVAPVAYLWWLELTTALFGSGTEAVLRLPSLASDLATLIGVGFLARRLLPPWGALAATALAAVSPPLLTYSWEIKQFATESAVTVGLLGAALAGPGPGAIRPLPRALGLAAAAPWFSLSSVFHIPGLLVMAWRRDRERPWPHLFDLAGVIAISAILLLLWAGEVRAVSEEFLGTYHQDGYGPPGLGPLLGWVGGRLLRLLGELHNLKAGMIVGVAVGLLGGHWLARRRPPVAGLIASAVTLWLLAGALGLYPAGLGPNVRECRLSLHLLPLVLLVLGAGVAALEEGPAPRLAPLVGVVLVVLSLWHFPIPGSKRELRGQFQRLFTEVRPGDLVGLGAGAYTQWEYHVATGRAPGEIPAVESGPWWDRYEGEAPPIPPDTRRVWWLDSAGMYHDGGFEGPWKAALAAGFVRAPEQPPEPHLSLWVRREP